jgi:actin-related protein 6
MSEVYLSTYPVTRAEYQEHGSTICRKKLGGPQYNVTPPGFTDGEAATGDIDEDEQERRYALGLESIRGRGGKKKREEEEVTSGQWGGRRRRGLA